MPRVARANVQPLKLRAENGLANPPFHDGYRVSSTLELPFTDADAFFAAALTALTKEMTRLRVGATDPKAVQTAFNEAVRIRESVFRFGEVRTIRPAANHPHRICPTRHLLPEN